MRKSIVLGLTAALLLVAPSLAGAASYSVDAAHSHIGFKVRHFGLSSVRGEFTEFSAALEVDEENLANTSVSVEIQAASIDTRNERRDGHLRSDDFLGVEAHPTISFVSKEIRAAGEGYEVVGDLTIRDTTREVSFPVEVAGPLTDPWGNVRLGIDGELTIDRQKFGVKWSQSLDAGGLVVADQVRISFSIEAMRPAAEEAAEGGAR